MERNSGFQWPARRNASFSRCFRGCSRTAAYTMAARSREAGVMCRRRSGCFAVVVPQQSAQSFAARDFAGCPAYLFPRCDQEVADPLMIALRMKMLKVKKL